LQLSWATFVAQRCVLDKREAVQVPRQRPVGVLLRQHDQATIAPHQLAEGGERLAVVEGDHGAVEAGAGERLRDVGRAHVGLDEQDHDLAGVVVEERSHLGQRVDHPCGAELTDRVAEPDVALPPLVAADADPSDEALCRPKHVRRQALGDPVA
jgi:hypothetical protein